MCSVLCWVIETGPIEHFYKSSTKVGFLALFCVAIVDPLVSRFLSFIREG